MMIIGDQDDSDLPADGQTTVVREDDGTVITRRREGHVLYTKSILTEPLLTKCACSGSFIGTRRIGRNGCSPRR